MELAVCFSVFQTLLNCLSVFQTFVHNKIFQSKCFYVTKLIFNKFILSLLQFFGQTFELVTSIP